MKQYQLCVLSSVGEAVPGSALALLSLAVVKLIALYPILTWKKDCCVFGYQLGTGGVAHSYKAVF